ncbi:FtsW/RodA/SpoVE family cell cycle protein [Anaeroselena agilis]|uniref:Probable peptidoglycan glycosyltransferase FtsW n=1 Tax=Anaeroselena agilis TaxID=3063788 RepID=A0ABU3P265_9FIRM|nr:putative peptidoglycan glycosyltransferase FtsW [Selenomonadales bacterium 4137-cl]
MRRVPVPWASPGEAVLYIVLILFAIGAINVFSASFVLAGQLLNDSLFFLKRHLVAFAVGMVGLAVAASIDYRRLIKYLPLIVLVMLALLVAVHFAGIDANGARRWLKLGIKFQPSEFAKLTALLMAAAYLGPRLEKGRPVTIFSWPVIVAGVMGFLVLRQPDMGTAVVIVGLCLILYLPSGIPKRQVYGLLFCGAMGTVYLVYAAAYRAERILAWLDPWSYEQTSGYQTVQALMAIGSGGLFGTGLGMGASKFYYLPEAHTDFAFAVLCQEMGFAGAFLVLSLFALLAWYGIKITLQARDGVGMMVAAGATFLIVGQAAGNIAMVSGLLPVTGIPLPFISFGGTSLVVNLLATGLLISVGRLGGKGAPPDETGPEKESVRLKLVNRRLGRK